MRAFLVISCLLFSAPPSFALELLAVPARHSATLEAEMHKALGTRWKLRPVFSSAEAKSLALYGERDLGFSLHLSVEDDKEAEAFRSWARKNAPSFAIEGNPRIRATAESLRSHQWALGNAGGTYPVDIDDFTRQNIPAVAGEDIGLAGAPLPTKTITVAVLDSGIDLTHPALTQAIVRHEEECKALAAYQACVAKAGAAKCESALADHDGNGYPLDCQGWNLVGDGSALGLSVKESLPHSAGIVGDWKVNDTVGHGTHVAGIIAARGNSLGTEGVAPQVKILPVRVISGEPNEAIRAQQTGLPAALDSNLKGGTGLGDSVARGILYALRSNAQVINMSLGWPDPLDSQLVRRMIQLARSRGVLLVAAAGNDSTDSVILPCRYDGVICVGAHGPDGALTFFSNFGYGVDILAPGWNILSTFPLDLLPIQFTGQAGYEAKDGSSMAAPFVSGILARLLGSGLSPDEAYSRMILGARSTRNSQVEDPALFASSSISGNADLAASYRVAPQSLVLPARKEPSRVEWDGIETSVPIRFELMDHWLDGQDVKIEIEATSGFAKLARGSWNVPAWKAQEMMAFATDLKIIDPRLSSDLDFEVHVTSANGSSRTFRLRANIVVPVSPTSALRDGSRRLPLVSEQSQALTREYDEIHTVETEDASSAEYIGVSESAGTRTLELIAEMPGGKMVVRGSVAAPSTGLSVTSLRKIHDPESGNAVYALVETTPAGQGPVRKASASQFSYFDSSFRAIPGATALSVDPAVTFLAEDFQWQKFKGKLVPTWYAVGTIPPLERKAYNPWKPKENTASDFRIFFLGLDGLHSLALPKEFPLMVSLVPQTLKQKREGTVSVLVAKGSDYALEYGLAQLREGAWSEVRPIQLPTYHHLRGLIAAKVLSLDSSDDGFAGAAFSGYVSTDTGPHGSRRSTLVGKSGIADFTAETLRHFDLVTDVAGSFSGASRVAQFSLTKFDIQYHDHTIHQSKRVSQKRFSFLPSIFTFKSFFPLVAEDSKLRERIPGLFVPGDFVFSKATQLILPRYESSGRLAALERPALFHLETRQGCTALPAAKAASSSAPSQLMFFCGNHFMAVPVRY